MVKAGVYIGDSPNQFGRDNHDFKEADGTVVSLNAAGQLDYLLTSHAQLGDTVRIIYAGTNTLEKGRFKGKEAHNFELHLKDGPQRAATTAVETEEEEDLSEVDVTQMRNAQAQETEEQEETEETEEEETEEDDVSLTDLEG